MTEPKRPWIRKQATRDEALGLIRAHGYRPGAIANTVSMIRTLEGKRAAQWERGVKRTAVEARWGRQIAIAEAKLAAFRKVAAYEYWLVRKAIKATIRGLRVEKPPARCNRSGAILGIAGRGLQGSFSSAQREALRAIGIDCDYHCAERLILIERPTISQATYNYAVPLRGVLNEAADTWELTVHSSQHMYTTGRTTLPVDPIFRAWSDARREHCARRHSRS
jgi:hypothetical protein